MNDEIDYLLSDDQDDLPERVGALMGIHVALILIFAGDTDDRVREWLSAPNQAPSTGGLSAILAMIEDGLPAMVRIRRHLETEVAG